MDELTAYESLKQDIASLRDQTMQALQSVIVVSNWEIGRRLDQDPLVKENAKQTLLELSKDLGMEYSALARMVQFYRAWPATCPADEFQNLSWSHFRSLLPVTSDTKRASLAEQADSKGWSVLTLREKIQTGGKPAEGVLVSEETGDAVLTRRDTQLFVYAAEVKNVIDGDTILVDVDLGFEVHTHERLRLRGIDCPERKTPQGMLATEFVEGELAGVKRIMVQTFWIDVFGRYVVDVFFKRGETDREKILSEGRFLNQALLDAGHAVLM